MKTDDELRRDNPELFKVARENATEPPFTGKYVTTDEAGVYHCAVCDAPLFASDTKFESHSGWPSFTEPVVQEAVTLRDDDSDGLRRIEVRCANCDAHLGHVFPDGPEEKEGDHTKVCDRYCINSISLELKNE